MTKVNFVFLCAGSGKRFSEAGYQVPKPLIYIGLDPMIKIVYNNMGSPENAFFIVQREHCKNYQIDEEIKEFCPSATIITVDKLTDGAARTALLAKAFINDHTPLVIVNSDQFVTGFDPQRFVNKLAKGDQDGLVLTFSAFDSKWSFVKLDQDGFITKVAEKTPISSIATVGVYGFKRGDSFVRGAETMISKNIRTNGEFYLAPSINELIEEGQQFLPYWIDEMFGLGTPEDLKSNEKKIRELI